MKSLIDFTIQEELRQATVRVQLGYSGIRREEERVRRRRKGGYIEGTGRIQWGYSESTVGYSEYTVRVHWGTVRIQ